jgi:hypothetical protein
VGIAAAAYYNFKLRKWNKIKKINVIKIYLLKSTKKLIFRLSKCTLKISFEESVYCILHISDVSESGPGFSAAASGLTREVWRHESNESSKCIIAIDLSWCGTAHMTC